MLTYFAQAEHEQHFGTELGGCPACGTTRPEFIFDVLETPLRDLSGDIIYEENVQGQLVPARRFSPDYWRDKYESFRLLQDVKQIGIRKARPSDATALIAPTAPGKKRFAFRWRDEWTQFRTLWRRAFISKMRNRGNLILTLAVPPLLACGLGGARLHEDSTVVTRSRTRSISRVNLHCVLVALFLALMNSSTTSFAIASSSIANAISMCACVLHLAKFGTLALFTRSSALSLSSSGIISPDSGHVWPYLWFMSSPPRAGWRSVFDFERRRGFETAANFVPLVLIPH